LKGKSEERNQLRHDVQSLNATLAATERKEQELFRELQYVQSLLPPQHPSARLSKLLQQRALSDVSPEEIKQAAIRRKADLISTARAFSAERQRGPGQTRETEAVPPRTATVPPQEPNPTASVLDSTNALKNEIEAMLQRSSRTTSPGQRDAIGSSAKTSSGPPMTHSERSESAQTASTNRSASIAEISEKLNAILNRRKALPA
jgi:hypothetical protein